MEPNPYFFTHSGSDWWGLDGINSMPTPSIPSSKNSATFPQPNSLTLAAIRRPYLVVTSNGGKRTERVTATKHNDSYIAKRESEPALYELSSSAVTDLQSAAKKVRPAPAPPPAGPKR